VVAICEQDSPDQEHPRYASANWSERSVSETIRRAVGRPGYRRAVEPWDEQAPSVLRFPSGRLVRGRGLRNGEVAGVTPEFGLYLQGQAPPPVDWPSRWVRWPDMWLPADPADAKAALRELWRRAETERVEVACSGGQGRTGTALACLAILDGIPAASAIAFVRERYNPRAVQTPWQRRFVRQFQP
jgi:Protein-tyrosine phosphatase